MKKPSQTYQDIIQGDVSGAPEFLAHAAAPDFGTEPVSADRYFSREFSELENKYLWPRVWQMACHQDDIPKKGDCFHFEIADRSLIIVNTGSGVRAFHNSCLHKGRKLISGHCRKSDFVCPFHAITWSLEGELKSNPIAWDMPHWSAENSKLPEARIAQWGGFVFVCLDASAPSFEDIMGRLPVDFEPYDWENRYRAWWVEKHIDANWKTTAEPFMESHHSQTTHPQLLPSIADINSQYDFLNAYVSRHISAAATASPSLQPQPTKHEQLVLMRERGDKRVDGVDIAALPKDFNTRSYIADIQRKRLEDEEGYDYSRSTDSEVLDYLLYGVFPHMAFWAGDGGKLVYRWRPRPGDPEGSTMDIMWMERVPKGQKRPKPARKVVLGPDEGFEDVKGMSSSLKLVLQQDFGNIPHVQARHMHQMIDAFIETGKAGSPPPGADL